MNILQILPELNVGGVETGTVDLARELVRLGHKAVVVSAGGVLVKELEAVGAVHYTLSVSEKSLLNMVRSVGKLAEIIVKERIDVVHARSRVPAWIAFFACRRTAAVFITTCHGYYSLHPLSHVMGWGRRVIVLSNVIGRHMIEDFKTPHERIRLIPRSVDLQRFSYRSPDAKRGEYLTVGIIGRITPLKGHLDFIKAMAKVIKVFPNLKILIVGDAPESKQAYKEELYILVKRLGLWNATQFLGTQRDIPGVLQHLDLLVLATTTQEAFGRVVVEAQAAGVPVVATRVGGVVDIIEDQKTGLLVSPADPAGMAEACIAVLKDAQLARSISEAAYRKVKEKYNLPLMVKSTLAVYEEALQRKRVLVIKLSAMGDIVLSSAAMRALSERLRPRYAISVLVSLQYKDLYLRCPYVDEVIVVDMGRRGLGQVLRLSSQLRSSQFDICVDLQNNRFSHLLAYLALIPQRYGYRNRKFGHLLNHGIREQGDSVDPLTHQFRILRPLGIELIDHRLEVWPGPDDEASVTQFLNSQWLSPLQKLIGMNASASTRWLSKQWGQHSMVKLAEALGKRDMRLVITGGEDDVRFAEELCEAAAEARPLNACGKTTMNGLACLIRRCSVYVSTDSAPLHVASACGVPYVALFGPTDPRRHLPPAKASVVIQKTPSCGPCYRSKCKRKNTCMEAITPEEVLAAIESLLEKKAGQ